MGLASVKKSQTKYYRASLPQKIPKLVLLGWPLSNYNGVDDGDNGLPRVNLKIGSDELNKRNAMHI